MNLGTALIATQAGCDEGSAAAPRYQQKLHQQQLSRLSGIRFLPAWHPIPSSLTSIPFQPGFTFLSPWYQFPFSLASPSFHPDINSLSAWHASCKSDQL